MRIIRLLLVVMMLSIITDTHAARMSDYTDNTTPNADVYFIGVDPNDTSQTVRGSNYRYSLASILGNGLLDATFKSLTVSGPGDSWLELDNNTSFTDSLTGKYGIRFYNGVLQQIINGTASAIGAGGSAPTLQADDPDMSDATGWYLATGSGDLFYVNSGIGMWTFAGTYSGDVTDPVIGTITPSALTHDGTGATLTATIASVTETNEDYRQWSLYDVTDAAVQVDWATFTGLSISGISIPADQHTYRVDVRVYDLAGNDGTASSANIEYSTPVSALMHWSADSATVLDTPSDRGITAVGGAGVGTYAGRQAANADGYDRYFTVATPTDLLSTANFDIEIDVYIPSGSTGGTVFRLEGLSGGEALQIGVTPTGINCYYATSSNHAYTTTVSTNAWHTVRWRFNTSTNSSIVSLDTTDNTTTITENMTTSYTGMTLGGRSGYDGFDGYFDEVYSHEVD